MSGLAKSALSQIQEIKAQSLGAMMASIEAISAVNALASAGGMEGHALEEAMRAGALKTFDAIVLSPPQNGKIVLSAGGQIVEAELPPELLRSLAASGTFLREGSKISLQFDPVAKTFRIVPPGGAAGDVTKSPIQTGGAPATVVTLSPGAIGARPAAPLPPPSLLPPPAPLANPFPAGSIGEAVARLTGLNFPLAEAETSGTAVAKPAFTSASAARMAHIAAIALPVDVQQALLKAAAQQSPLAAAFSQIAQLSAAGGLPAGLAKIVDGVLGLRLDVSQPITADAVMQALAKSGLFQEANLAQGKGEAAAGDLKSQLLALKARLSAPPPPPGAEAGPAPPNADLAKAVDGALERIKLMQIASLPDHPDIVVTDDRAQGMRLSLSLPVAMQGHMRPEAATIGLMIEHQPQNEPALTPDTPLQSSDPETFPWKVRLALDLEETGPVQAEIALRGQAIAITLWAEHRGMAGLARAEIGTLHRALSDAAFDVTRLEVKDGRPAGRPARNTPVLDRRT